MDNFFEWAANLWLKEGGGSEKPQTWMLADYEKAQEKKNQVDLDAKKGRCIEGWRDRP